MEPFRDPILRKMSNGRVSVHYPYSNKGPPPNANNNNYYDFEQAYHNSDPYLQKDLKERFKKQIKGRDFGEYMVKNAHIGDMNGETYVEWNGPRIYNKVKKALEQVNDPDMRKALKAKYMKFQRNKMSGSNSMNSQRRQTLSRMTLPQLKDVARNVGHKGFSTMKKQNLVNALARIESSRINATLNRTKHEIAEDLFLRQGDEKEKNEDASEVAEELISNENDASTLMLSILPPRERGRVLSTWKALLSQQVKNGSFLEFQGMRFMSENTTVYDVERNAKEEAAVIAHILQPPPPGRVKVYLKCKFSMDSVNADTEPIQSGGSKTWRDLYTEKLAKGREHCEPDVIIRTATEVRIFEMKMGLGKSDTKEKATEANQLARCKRALEYYLTTNITNVRSSQIKLFFVGWSAESNSTVNFTPAPWSIGEYEVTPLNGMGMTRYAPIDSAFVTKLISLLNVLKLENFYKAAGLFLKKWGPYYKNFREWKRQQMINVAQKSNTFGKAFNAPPEIAVAKKKTAKEAAAAAATEASLRGSARQVRNISKQVRGNNSSSNSNNENARVRRYNWVNRHTSSTVKRQRLIEQYTGNQLRALAALANTRRAAGVPMTNARVLGLVDKNASNWDITYAKFLNEHTNIPNASARINALLRNPPPNKVANYANKLMKKQRVNSRRARPALPQ